MVAVIVPAAAVGVFQCHFSDDSRLFPLIRLWPIPPFFSLINSFSPHPPSPIPPPLTHVGSLRCKFVIVVCQIQFADLMIYFEKQLDVTWDERVGCLCNQKEIRRRSLTLAGCRAPPSSLAALCFVAFAVTFSLSFLYTVCFLLFSLTLENNCFELIDSSRWLMWSAVGL